MKRSIVILVSAIILSVSAEAQNFQRYNLGFNDVYHYNPAAQVNDGSDIYVLSKYNFLKLTDPDNYTFNENPLDITFGGSFRGKWGGVSMEASHDGYSYFDRHCLRVGYGYQWHVDDMKAPQEHRRIAVAGGLTFGFDKVDWSKHYIASSGQTFFCSPDMYLAMEYMDNHIRVGITGMNLISLTDDIDGRRNPRLVMVHFSYSWLLGREKAWGLMPYVTTGYCERATFELGLQADWKKIVTVSYGFRAMDMVHICHLGIGVPKFPLSIEMGCAIGAFNKERYASLGLRYLFD